MLNDLAFTRRKQFDPLVIDGADQRRVGKSSEGMVEIHATRPHLSFMDATNALAQALQPFLFGKNSPCAGTKTLQNLARIRGLEQDDALDLRPKRPHLPQNLGTVARLVV